MHAHRVFYSRFEYVWANPNEGPELQYLFFIVPKLLHKYSQFSVVSVKHSLNTSKICMGNLFALMRNSRSCGFQLKWLDFAVKFHQATVNVTARQIFQRASFFHSVFHSLPWCYPNIALSHLQIGFAYSWLLQKTVSTNISWSNPICMFLFIYTDWVTACQVLTAHFNKSSKYVWFYCLLLPRHQLWSMWCGLPAIEPQLFEAAIPSLSTENKLYWHF